MALRISIAFTMAIWGHLFLTVFYALALLLILTRLKNGGIAALRRPWMTRLGAVTDTVYLFHPLFLAVVFMFVARAERISSFQDLGWATVALCVTLLWSTVSLKFLRSQ